MNERKHVWRDGDGSKTARSAHTTMESMWLHNQRPEVLDVEMTDANATVPSLDFALMNTRAPDAMDIESVMEHKQNARPYRNVFWAKVPAFPESRLHSRPNEWEGALGLTPVETDPEEEMLSTLFQRACTLEPIKGFPEPQDKAAISSDPTSVKDCFGWLKPEEFPILQADVVEKSVEDRISPQVSTFCLQRSHPTQAHSADIWMVAFVLFLLPYITLATASATCFAGLGGCALPQIASAVVSTLLSAVVNVWSRSFSHTETCGDLLYDNLDANLAEWGTGGPSVVGDYLTGIDGF